MKCSACDAPRGRVARNKRAHGADDLCGRCYGRVARSVRNSRVSSHARRRWNIASRYRLTEADIERMLQEQERRCAICLNRFGDVFHIDHDHKTGVVRGLLCAPCNWNLPIVEDEQRLAAALAYLRRFRCDI